MVVAMMESRSVRLSGVYDRKARGRACSSRRLI